MAPVDSIGPNNLEDLMDHLWRDGDKWNDPTLKLGFPTSPTPHWEGQGVDASEFTALNSAARANFVMAAQLWADLCGVSFENLGPGDQGNIRAFGWNRPDAGWAAKVGSSPGFNVNMDVQINTGWTDGPGSTGNTLNWLTVLNPGQGGFKLLLHEIGHTLGLDHPGPYDVGDGATYDTHAEYIQDSDQYSLMSYFAEFETGADFDNVSDNQYRPNAIDAPMLHDIYAIQNIYGADLDTRDGNTTYGYNASGLSTSWEQVTYDFDVNVNPVFAIWDAGGYDTLDLSGDPTDIVLDLRPGAFSSTHNMTYNLALAFNPDSNAYPNLDHFIERGIGGAGDDDITGNHKNNALHGNGGDDDISGLDSADWIEGDAGQDWLYGGNQSDTAYGGADADQVSGNNGNDRLYGEGSTDFVYGNSGADTVYGGSSGDYLYGGEQDEIPWSATLLEEFADAGGHEDLIFGEDGNDAIDGGNGDDLLSGGFGDDALLGGGGEDIYVGGGGVDTVNYQYSAQDWKVRLDTGQAGIGAVYFEDLSEIENLLMGMGDDWVRGSSVANVVSAFTGNDTVSGLEGDDSISGLHGHDSLSGGDGEDTATGGNGNDTMSGGNHDDELDGDSGADRMDGNDGSDLLDGGANNDALNGGSANDYLFGGTGHDDLAGSSGNDYVWGNAGGDLLEGGSGNDDLRGMEDNDTIRGGSGSDTVEGSSGVDMLDFSDSNSWVRADLAITTAQDVGYGSDLDLILNMENATGSSLGDTLRGEGGANQLWGLGGNDMLEGRAGNDYINGGLNVDTASYESAASGVMINLANALPQNTLGAGIDSLISIERLIGSDHADILLGDVVGNHLSGGDGNDWLAGGAGDNWVNGGHGDDLVFAGIGDEILSAGFFQDSDTVSYLFATSAVTATINSNTAQNTGGGGTDRLYFFDNLDGSNYSDDLTGTSSANQLNGHDGHDDLHGLSGNDTMNGGVGSDDLYGDSGNDSLNGGGGDDTVRGGDGADSIIGEGGDDNLRGEDGNDTMDGGNHDDVLFGSTGNDSMNGAANNDTLTGGAGYDTMTGGTGADRFAYQAMTDSGIAIPQRDHILDFEHGIDRMDFSAIDAVPGGGGDPFTFTGLGNILGLGQIRALQAGADTHLYINTAGDVPPEMVIVLHNQLAAELTVGDFIL